jgi:hypothetical protein
MDDQMCASLAILVAGVVLIDRPVAELSGKPVARSALSTRLTGGN